MVNGLHVFYFLQIILFLFKLFYLNIYIYMCVGFGKLYLGVCGVKYYFTKGHVRGVLHLVQCIACNAVHFRQL